MIWKQVLKLEFVPRKIGAGATDELKNAPETIFGIFFRERWQGGYLSSGRVTPVVDHFHGTGADAGPPRR